MVRLEIGNGRPGGRLYLRNHRCHHGMIGCCLIALGALLCAHDWADRPWLRDTP